VFELLDAQPFDDNRSAWSQFPEFVGDDSFVGFASVFSSFSQLDDRFLAVTTTAEFACALGSHMVSLCGVVVCKF
jgi:hypothetical protein